MKKDEKLYTLHEPLVEKELGSNFEKWCCAEHMNEAHPHAPVFDGPLEKEPKQCKSKCLLCEARKKHKNVIR